VLLIFFSAQASFSGSTADGQHQCDRKQAPCAELSLPECTSCPF